ncbi:hypothetical protein IMSAG025_02372 [Muribaculaceae bacterium]|nr:hypothetical protein IMSAG025_02372 [Muribaculaceae bacterium]
MNCEEFIRLSREWKGNVCLCGAGEIGGTWAYELISNAGFHIIFYCDNYRTGETLNNLDIKKPEFLYANASDLLCFITVGVKISKQIEKQLKQNGVLNTFIINDINCINELARFVDENPATQINEKLKRVLSDEWWISRQFKDVFGYFPDLQNPKTMNEKLQWLKLNDQKPEYELLVDKYRVREYIAQNFGSDYLVPLLYVTSDYEELSEDKIPDTHCIIKSNCSSHDFEIIRSKKDIDWEKLKLKYKKVFESNFYYVARERCYKEIKPLLLVEKLLETEEGKIPNDYKLHFFNGKCEFVYCSVDREGMDYRKIYDVNWNELVFDWSTSDKNHIPKKGPDIPQPVSFGKMLEIGKKIAEDKRYVRVDFYDVHGKLYCGEITLYHGAGYDRFIPNEYDLIYGKKLIL